MRLLNAIESGIDLSRPQSFGFKHCTVFPHEVRLPESNHRRRSMKRISLLSFKVQLQLSAHGEPSKATAPTAAAREAEEPVPELRRAADLQDPQEVPLLRLRDMMPGLNRTDAKSGCVDSATALYTQPMKNSFGHPSP